MKISDEEWGILTMKITLKTILRMSSSYCKCEFCWIAQLKVDIEGKIYSGW